MKRLVLVSTLVIGAAMPAFAGWDEGQAAFQSKDWPTALREFAPLANSGHAGATSRLGHMYFEGIGVAKNETEGLRLLMVAAEKGDAMAQDKVGMLYHQGRGLPRDVSQAVLWLGRAAAQDLPNALNNLGQMLYFGHGMPKDELKGLEFLRRAAEKGEINSIGVVAQAYWIGRGVTQDHAVAVDWFRKASERGHKPSQNMLGLALWNGEGVAKNEKEALRWFEAAAAQGSSAAQFNAGIAYAKGIGTDKNLEKAAFLLIIAAQTASTRDKTRFEASRDEIKGQAGPEIWGRASARARNWRPGMPLPASQAEMAAPAPVLAPAQATPPTPSQKVTALMGPKPMETAPPRPHRGTGSGLVVGRDGTILTNSHVVQSCRNIRVTLEGQPVQAASVVARDAATDLAALKASMRPTDVARFREDKQLRSGDNVVAVGYPLATLLSREPNVTAGVISALAGLHGDKRHYQITAPIQRGNSGGPIADTSGNVVGIVTATLNATKVGERSGGAIPQNVNFAIKAELVRKFLSENGIAYETAPASANLSPADVGDLVRKVTVFVECDG